MSQYDVIRVLSSPPRVSCIALVLIWVRLLKYGRAFKIIGPLIVIISHLIGDICKYFAIKLVFYIPFVICFWLLFGGPQAEGQEDAEDLTQFYRVMMVLFRMTLVDDYPYSVSPRASNRPDTCSLLKYTDFSYSLQQSF